MTRAARLLGVTLALAVAACTENLTAPGACPEFCPDAQLQVLDTVLRTAIDRDSAFRGYFDARDASGLIAASFAWVDSRPIFRTQSISQGTRFGTDTTLRPISGVDSLRLALTILLRDTAARNLTVHLHRLPLTIDSTTTFADVAGSFADPPIRSVNIDGLLALTGRRDPATRDSVVVDAADVRRLTLLVGLDSAHVPYMPADSGRVAFGVRVTADTLPGLTVGRFELGPQLSWYTQVDSAGVQKRDTVPRPAGVAFDNFVFDPPPPALDATLAVGGVPSARSILRVTLPRSIRDSTQIVRATLVLVPAVAARGLPADSFQLVAHLVETDLGAKSPLAQPRFQFDFSTAGATTVRIGASDTVRIELTPMARRWTVDTGHTTTIILRQVARAGLGGEGGTLSEIRFRSSRDAALRPALHVTYVPRYRFEGP